MTLDKFMQDRDAAILWARKLLEHGEFVILDTETTGLDSAAEIIEISVIDPRGQPVMSRRIRPSYQCVMDERAFAVHGISLESVQEEFILDYYADELAAALKGKTVVCWNASFDTRMLYQSFAVYGRSLPILDLLQFECAMLQYADYYGDWDARRGQYRWQKLPGATHGAIADCRATLEALRQMAKTPLSTEGTIVEIDTTINYENETIRQDVTFEPPATPEPTPLRTIAFEHGHGSVTLGPPPESTSTTVEVELHDDGTDPAANGYTFNLFEDAAEGATPANTFEYYNNLARMLNIVGAPSITVEHVAAWSSEQRVAAATWAAKTATAQIDLSLNGHGEFPTWPEFFPAGEIPF